MEFIKEIILQKVYKLIPLKTRRKVIDFKKTISLDSEFLWQNTVTKGDVEEQHRYSLFTASHSEVVTIESKGKTLLDKISKNHTTNNLPMYIVVVDSCKVFKRSIGVDNSIGQTISQKEYQKIIFYTLEKKQIEKIVKTIISRENKK
ncbi:MAG: hypothetical protein ACR2IQ_01620 [Minisyncoccia bacterium]